MPLYRPSLSAGISTIGNTAGNTGIAEGRLVLAGGSNITLSGSTNGVSMTVTISGGAGGAGDGGNILAAGTRTAGSNSSVLFSNLNGLTWGLDAVNGSVMTASHNGLTTAMASNRGSDFVQATAAFAGTNASGTIASGGISVSVNAGGGGDAIRGIAAGGSTASTSTVNFSNSNGISFGFGAAGNSTVMTASHNAITTGRASTDAIGLNTAKTNVTWTVNSAGLSFDAAGYAGTTTGFGGTNISGSATLNSAGLNLSLSVAAGGGAAPATISNFNFGLGNPIAGTTSFTVGGSSVFVEPMILPLHLSASYLRLPISAGFGSSTFASTANTTLSMNQSLTAFFCIYSQGVGASSKSIQSIYSSSVTGRLNVDYRVGAASGNQSCSHAITYQLEGASSVTFSTSYAPAASSILRVSTTHLTAFTGALFLDIPFASLMTPGNYWLAIQRSSATAVTGVAGMNALTSQASFVAVSQISSNIRGMGVNTTAGSNMWQGDGHGWWTTNTLGATTASMALSQISTIANQPVVPFRFDREA